MHTFFINRNKNSNCSHLSFNFTVKIHFYTYIYLYSYYYFPCNFSNLKKLGKIKKEKKPLRVQFFWLKQLFIFSIILCYFQSVIFHVQSHPDFPWFHQCVTFDFFPSLTHELAYNIFNIFTVYILPLSVIIVSYALILGVISQRAREKIGTE